MPAISHQAIRTAIRATSPRATNRKSAPDSVAHDTSGPADTDEQRSRTDSAWENTEGPEESDAYIDTDDQELSGSSAEDAADSDDSDTIIDTGDDDDEDAETDDDARTVKAPARGRRKWRRRARVAVAGLIIASALAGLAGLGWTVWQQREVTKAGQAAQQAAVAYAQLLTSIDSAKIDDNFNQVLNGATGEFKDMYSQASTQLRQLLLDNKASAHGVVVDSAIQSATKNKVVVLLFVDQSVSNTNVPDPRIDRSRVRITMEKVDSRWRASKVELP